jgi:hypothetical protein
MLRGDKLRYQLRFVRRALGVDFERDGHCCDAEVDDAEVGDTEFGGWVVAELRQYYLLPVITLYSCRLFTMWIAENGLTRLGFWPRNYGSDNRRRWGFALGGSSHQFAATPGIE